MMTGFTFDERIGEGQASTWRGRDPQNNPVVIKVLELDHRAHWKGIELFEREVGTLAQLAHPQIPRLVASDLGRTQATRWMFAQQWIDGPDLRELTLQTEAEVYDLAFQVLTILAYLQSFSPPVIHRDIKPANIVRQAGVYFLVDFGAVQLVTPSDEGGSTVVGTSGYMPPEQLMGRAVPASDLFSLGMTLVRVVTGCEPDSLPVHRLRIVWRDRLVVPISSSLRDFIDTLISPHIEDRFQDAQHALDSLQFSEAMAPFARPRDTDLELTKSSTDWVIKKPGNEYGIFLLASALGVPLLGIIAGIVLDVSLKSWATYGLVIVVFSAIMLAFFFGTPQARRLQFNANMWAYYIGRRRAFQGPISEIIDFGIIRDTHGEHKLGLICEDRTYPLFDVDTEEEAWLREELRDYLASMIVRRSN